MPKRVICVLSSPIFLQSSSFHSSTSPPYYKRHHFESQRGLKSSTIRGKRLTSSNPVMSRVEAEDKDQKPLTCEKDTFLPAKISPLLSSRSGHEFKSSSLIASGGCCCSWALRTSAETLKTHPDREIHPGVKTAASGLIVTA
ncbi:hypothetical protein KQX54_007730 [Cotesia glomerata]|uniref:Uncharacterized protein n=1 Tax=Cotesia glomerata TaxID=32391 RepID=A0AAV7J6G2_COTGL|nr:hypothetical protein KQX54_007730 [Cotesia glomerata]